MNAVKAWDRWIAANRWTILAVVAFAQIVWLAWVLNEPLPNARGAGEVGMRRSYLLWRFLPEVVPGVRWHESFLGLAAKELGQVQNLPQRLPIVLAAGFILVAGVSLGGLVLRGVGPRREMSRLEHVCIAYGIGMTGLGLAALIAGRFGVLSTWVARLGLVVPIVVAMALWVRERIPGGWWVNHPPYETNVSALSIVGLLGVVGPFVVVMALGSMLPTIDFDAIEYHLQGPKEYFQAGRITFLPHNVYTSMPFGVEMLHLLGMNVANDWWLGALVGQLLVMTFAPMAGLAVWLTARRWASPRAAWVATAVYLTTPWVYRLAAIPYVEGPLCYYHAAIAWAAGLAWSAPEADRARAWGVVGLLAGGAMAIKYPALISAVVPFGAVAMAAGWRDKSWRGVIAFGVGVAVVMGPWMVKNVVDTGNPVYPLGYRVFGGRDWDVAREKQWTDAHGPRPIEAKAFVGSILDVAGRSDWQSPAVAALAPLAFLWPRSRRLALSIGGYVLYLFLTWWFLTHRLDRFWLPMLPGLAVLAGIGADGMRGRVGTAIVACVLTIATVSNFVYCSTALAGLNEWTGDLTAMRTSVPKMLNPALARLDAELPDGAKPLLVGQAAVFHLAHPVVYNTVFDRDTFEAIDRERSPDEVRSELARRGITHIFVDWFEIERYRSPGNYGFTPYVTPDRFERLVRAGVIGEPKALGARQELFEVIPAR